MDHETPRPWTHEEIGEEASRLTRAEGLIRHAVEDLRGLPSLTGELADDHSGLDAAFAALADALETIHDHADRAGEAAASSYVDECERQGAAIWDEWEERH